MSEREDLIANGVPQAAPTQAEIAATRSSWEQIEPLVALLHRYRYDANEHDRQLLELGINALEGHYHPAEASKPRLPQGHGHVRPLPRGMKARCGGPELCAICKREQAEIDARRPDGAIDLPDELGFPSGRWVLPFPCADEPQVALAFGGAWPAGTPWHTMTIGPKGTALIEEALTRVRPVVQGEEDHGSRDRVNESQPLQLATGGEAEAAPSTTAGPREIICWGDPEPQFRRLGVGPRKTFDGRDLTVWACDAADYFLLLEDERRHWQLSNTCWRSALGANRPMTDGPVLINGLRLIGGYGEQRREADAEDRAEAAEHGLSLPSPSVPEYDDLLTYFCDEIGASTPSNIAAVAAEMAQANGVTVGELFTRAYAKPTKS